MSPFDDLPRRPRSHEVEETAIVAFRSRLKQSGVFILQTADAKDYGTDCQIEVIVQGRATNVRAHVQLKGTEKALNANGGVSVDVSRTNLNYLLAQPYSFYVCYHLPTTSLRVAFVDDLLRKYEHRGGNWTEQQTLTVSFIEELTVDRLQMIADLMRSGSQVHKNLGTSYERLGDQDKAVEHYCEALRLDPDLAEAHYAMGNHQFHLGQFEEALSHFDRVVFADEELGKGLGAAGWRANALFNLGDGRGAFREINRLVGTSGRWPWVWPWCARQIASFGRANVENAIQAASFWQRYIAAFPEDGRARVELLLTKFYLRSAGHDIGRYGAFREAFDQHIAHVDESDQALPWDRLGHWAQDDDHWEEAERCFRKAYKIEGGHFGYCLGTALNFLGRHDEALPIVFEQAHVLQPDAKSWFQLAIAYEGVGKTVETIAAYVKAIELDPDYDLAMFNLGGVYWNTGDISNAVATWMYAIKRFPEHELTAKLRREMPTLFA